MGMPKWRYRNQKHSAFFIIIDIWTTARHNSRVTFIVWAEANYDLYVILQLLPHLRKFNFSTQINE